MGHAFVSPLRRWDVIAGLCQSIDAKTFVEVGCKEGRTTGFVLANCPDIRVIAIDPWMKQEASDDPTRETYADWDFDKIEREFWENVGENKGRVCMRRCTSNEAATDMRLPLSWLVPFSEPRQWQFDVVFIDALHDYESVVQDISMWWPKVREGGFLCGHDFNHQWPGVMRAVAEHFPLMRVGVCPDSVWFVQKPAAALKVAA
jgi:methyltransferase family protein